MKEYQSVEKVNLNCLTNPEEGRIYLKAALEQNEEAFLKALHNIIDSFLDAELDFSDELAPSPV